MDFNTGTRDSTVEEKLTTSLIPESLPGHIASNVVSQSAPSPGPVVLSSSATLVEDGTLNGKRKHNRFYMIGNFFHIFAKNDGGEEIAYRLPSHFFVQASSWFANRLQSLSDNSTRAITLDDVTSSELDALLCVLFPKDLKNGDLTEQREWTAVLKLSTRWSFESIRDLAIDELDHIISPVDSLVLARTYRIQKWIDRALEAICMRSAPLSLVEMRRMELVDIALIAYMHRTAPAAAELRRTIALWRRDTLLDACQEDRAILDQDIVYSPAEAFDRERVGCADLPESKAFTSLVSPREEETKRADVQVGDQRASKDIPCSETETQAAVAVKLQEEFNAQPPASPRMAKMTKEERKERLAAARKMAEEKARLEAEARIAAGLWGKAGGRRIAEEGFLSTEEVLRKVEETRKAAERRAAEEARLEAEAQDAIRRQHQADAALRTKASSPNTNRPSNHGNTFNSSPWTLGTQPQATITSSLQYPSRPPQ